MAEPIHALAEFDPLLLESGIKRTLATVSTSLPDGHPERTETVKLIAGDRMPAQPALTYGAVGRHFAAYMLKYHHGVAEESGSPPTYPYGPIGLSSDGILVSLSETPSGQVNLWTQSIYDGQRFFGYWHNSQNPDDGPIVMETSSRFAAASRALGEATLSPSIRSGEAAPFALVNIYRSIDLGATDYQAAHPDAPIPPIGALTDGRTIPKPIFPLHALINLDVKF
jgi:hypothetical protein